MWKILLNILLKYYQVLYLALPHEVDMIGIPVLDIRGLWKVRKLTHVIQWMIAFARIMNCVYHSLKPFSHSHYGMLLQPVNLFSLYSFDFFRQIYRIEKLYSVGIWFNQILSPTRYKSWLISIIQVNKQHLIDFHLYIIYRLNFNSRGNAHKVEKANNRV